MILVWFDNTSNYPDTRIYKDSFFGVINYRVSMLGDNKFLLTRFSLGSVTIENYSELDLLCLDLVSDISTTRQCVIRAMYEWTLTQPFLLLQSHITSYLSCKYTGFITRWLHICDTHHGPSPLSGAYQFSSSYLPDVVSCNQAHHLHFFDANKHILNLPRISIDGLFSIRKARYSSLGSIRNKLFFPSKCNSIHLRREYISTASNTFLSGSFGLVTSRFNQYYDWLLALATSYLFIYVPLGTSIGLNNLIPCFLTGTPVVSLPLSKYSGIDQISNFLHSQLSYVDSLESLLSFVKNIHDLPLCTNDSCSTDIKAINLPTPSSFITEWILGEAYYEHELSVLRLDSRFNELRVLKTSLDSSLYLSVALSFYEDIQNIIELFGLCQPLVFSFDHTIDNSLKKYLEQSTLDFVELASDVPKISPSHILVFSDVTSLSSSDLLCYSFLICIQPGNHNLPSPNGFNKVKSPLYLKPIHSTIFSRQELLICQLNSW